MADIGSLVANLMVNSSQFNRDLNKASRHTKSFSAKSNRALAKVEKKWKSLSKSLFSFKGGLAAIVGGYGVKKLASSFLDAATTSENFRVRLEVLLGSVDEGNRLFEQMADYAGKVPFQYEKVMASATQLSGVMKGGVDEITQWMPLIGDLAAAAGVDIEKATEQVVRMYSAGAASADLFREKGILAMMGFKAGVSYTAEETRKMMMETWQKADSQFKGATDKMANTWTGMISMISDKWFKLRNMIMDAGAFEELKSILSDIDERFGAWLETNKNIIALKVPEYINKIKIGFQKIWNILNYDPDIIKFGIIGLAFWGKKGAVVVGGLAHMVNWVKNLSAALALASTGAVSFKEVAAANFKELEAIVKRFDESAQGAMGNFVRMKMPKDTLPTETWVKTPEKAFNSTMEFADEYYMNLKEQSEKYLAGETERMNELIAFEKETDRMILDAKSQHYLDEATLAEERLRHDIELMNAAAEKEKQLSEFQIGLALATATSMQNTFSDFFFDAFTGELKTIEDYFRAFTKSLLRAFSDMVAQMIIKWAALKAITSLGFGDGFGDGFFGGLFHEGGIVGESIVPHKFVSLQKMASIPRLHSGLRSDEYPAILQKGETVIPADKDFALRPSLHFEPHFIFYGPVHGDEEFTEYMVDRLNDWVEDKGGKLIASQTV